MEKKKNGIVSYLSIILFFVVICYMVYYIVVSRYSKNNNSDDPDKVVINHRLRDTSTSTVNEYLLSIFDTHSSRDCGQVDYNDTYDFDDGMMVYYRSKDYNSLGDVKNNFSSIVSDKYFNDNLSDKFLENDGKLYCGLIPRGSLNYESGSVKVTGIAVDGDNLIVKGNYRTLETDLNASDTFNFEILMVKDNNNWVIDSYEEIDN